MILLDSGHGTPCLLGGKHSPSFPDGKIVYEADINRDVLARTKILFDDNFIINKNIVPEITDIGLHERVKRANAIYSNGYKNSVFLSIHHNAHGYGKEWTNANGYETWYYYKSSKSEAIAAKVQSQIGQLGTDRGIKKAFFPYEYKGKTYTTKIYVLKYTLMPAILVELGFMTNLKEATKMRDETHRQNCALKIYYGIKSCIDSGLIKI